MLRHRLLVLASLTLSTLSPAQHDAAANSAKPGPFVAPASDEAQKQIASFQLAPGLVCDLIAAEPDLCNAVAFAIDGKGRFYVAETFRINDGVFDTRSYMQWKDADLACLSVADRIAKYEKYIPNDIPKYAAFSERVRMLVDTDRNGTLDRSTVFADGFNELADGIGSGVLPVGNDVFFTNIPKLWRLRDTNGDGIADERRVVHDGFGVHTSLIGHDLHGLIVGPDRRLYFSIGDRGFHVQQGERTLAYPHEGAVLRCELDGSDLEVVHKGLRNPQELAFDQWGNLFTGDNNSDGGDRARFVPITAGADSGWRIGYQWLSDRGAWNREKMWHPRHPGQPAWIMPPIMNFADGPSGLAYDPGVGLPERYRDCFFLCDFRGGNSYSGVHALRLSRAGAGYELVSTEKPIWSVLATDVDFGPDGSMYVLDWVSTWTKTGKGRIYRVRTPQMANDMALRNGANLLASNLRERAPSQLSALLAHADRRVRQAAQFALVDLGATDELLAAAKQSDSRLARLHGIWGLGVLGRKQPKLLDGLLDLLDCGDADVRAMTARVLGDARVTSALPQLQKALSDGNSRFVKEAALALARLGASAAEASEDLIELLRHNDDRDHVLRHAAVFALASVAPRAALLVAKSDASTAVRLGVLLALARQKDAEVALFLRDAEPSLRYEAARAIYEEPIPAAMPALSRLCYDDTPDTEAIDWRAINANRMLGETENGEALVHLACMKNHPKAVRIEAIEVLAEWATPHGQDRVGGNWRPCVHPKAEVVSQCFQGSTPLMFADTVVAEAAAKAAGQMRLVGCAQALAALVAAAQQSDDARIAALDALDAMHAPELQHALATIDGSAPAPLRQRAVELLSRTAPESAIPVLATLLENASLGEKQAAFVALGFMQHEAATKLLEVWLGKLERGEVATAIQLDLLDAAEKHTAPAVKALLAKRDAAAAAAGPLGEYLVCREGGATKAGRKVFFDNEATNCTRCHTLQGTGGNAGPRLDGIGEAQTRDYLIEALITPSARIAEGFGSTTLDLHDGTMLTGFVSKDQDGAVTIVGVDGKPVDVAWSRISKRTANSTSAMPPMGGALSKRQLRDLIAFLAAQKKE
ncbi:MAG: PVC-type heme-binding CxxCH protein [Planctomycetota bacterium]